MSSARHTCFMTRETNAGKGEKTRLKVYWPSSLSHASLLRVCVRRIVEMTPDRTCFTHRARINGIGEKKEKKKTCSGLHGRTQVDGVGKQRVLSWTGGYFSWKMLHQFDSDPRVSLHSREHSRLGYTRANKKNVCLRENRFQTVSDLNFLDRIAEHRS